MESPSHFINGYWALDMKLPAGNSGGVNFAWYVLASPWAIAKHFPVTVDMSLGRA